MMECIEHDHVDLTGYRMRSGVDIATVLYPPDVEIPWP